MERLKKKRKKERITGRMLWARWLQLFSKVLILDVLTAAVQVTNAEAS